MAYMVTVEIIGHRIFSDFALVGCALHYECIVVAVTLGVLG